MLTCQPLLYVVLSSRFCSRVSGGAIVACLTELKEKKFIVIVHFSCLFIN